MPRLSTRELCLGAGCLVNTSGTWRRAVVINCTRSVGFDVKFIDTGRYDEILDDVSLHRYLPKTFTSFISSMMRVNAIHHIIRDYNALKLIEIKNKLSKKCIVLIFINFYY